MLLTMLAIQNNNDAYLELRAQLLTNDNDLALTLIYQNMNRMLDHMLEYSLQLLENEAAQNQNEITIRQLQENLREITQSANDCFCPCFCVGPNRSCGLTIDPNQNQSFCIDPSHCYDFTIDTNNCISFCFDPNNCFDFCLDPNSFTNTI